MAATERPVPSAAVASDYQLTVCLETNLGVFFFVSILLECGAAAAVRGQKAWLDESQLITGLLLFVDVAHS